jgi:hypothetical protein
MACSQLVETLMLIEREGGHFEVLVQGIVRYTDETGYGADADGNRGWHKTFVHEVIDIVATDEGLETVKLTASEDADAAELLTRKFLEG